MDEFDGCCASQLGLPPHAVCVIYVREELAGANLSDVM